MTKKLFFIAVVLIVALAASACVANINENIISPEPTQNTNNILLPATDSPIGVPARPGSGVSGDPSANLPDLVDVSGIVKEVRQDLVLITCDDGGDFMLRFSEHSTWAEGVNKEIKVGNRISCSVKLEPTFTTPSQGEVYEVFENNTVVDKK